MRKKTKRIVRMARVIVDSRDADKDISVELSVAQGLYDRGRLSWDLTNRCYCTKENGKVPKELIGGPSTCPL